MMTIGITGGVGAGKSQILSYIEERYNSKVIRADEVAHLLEEPGHECYDRIMYWWRELQNARARIGGG